MCIPRKPHCFGKEDHTICNDNLSKGAPIMFCVELVEGKDRPLKLRPKEFEDCGNTVGLMICMSKNLWNTGGINGQRLQCVKGYNCNEGERRVWPSFDKAKWKVMASVSSGGYCETIKQVVNGDQDTLQSVTNADCSWSTIRFKYPYPNTTTKQSIWLMTTTIGVMISLTKWWPTRQFTFLLEVEEANAANARGCARKQKAEPQLEFCRALAEKMLTNNLDNDGRTVVEVGRPVTQG
ncbi:LOW QUALITY PROTEIN: hypothetical protein ACHAXS_006076 [Conticribra weissflogii]